MYVQFEHCEVLGSCLPGPKYSCMSCDCIPYLNKHTLRTLLVLGTTTVLATYTLRTLLIVGTNFSGLVTYSVWQVLILAF